MITVKNLSYAIHKTPILKKINVTLPTGGITALIGPNGAGKSTLLSQIARITHPDEGEVFIDGTNVHTAPSREIALKLAFLSQHSHIDSRITVYDLLMFGRYPHHQGRIGPKDRQVVDDVMDVFNLTQLADRYISSLSGGQRQRALIAMTFTQETSHVLLDEPLNNLDMFYARELMRTLRKLTDERQLTTIMVVHDINVAAAWADHIVVLKDGQLYKEGSPQDIITQQNLIDIFGLDADVLEHNGKKLVIHHM